MSRRRLAPWLLALPLAALAVLAVWPILLAWQPAAQEAAPVTCAAKAPRVLAGQALKVMSWNLQFLAGRLPVHRPDRPVPAPVALDETTLARHLDRIAAVIRAEAPDVLLLQELHDGAMQTARHDQLALLQARLADLFPCSAEAFYRKAPFAPNRHEFGGVGLKLGILSRFKLEHAQRLQLPAAQQPRWAEPFAIQPALLVARLPMRPHGALLLATTQLDTQDAGAARHQGDAVAAQLDRWQTERHDWLLGGDFGLAEFDPRRSPTRLAEREPRVPERQAVLGPAGGAWLTYGESDPATARDLLFYSLDIKPIDARVLQGEARGLSDHLPLSARFLLPPPD